MNDKKQTTQLDKEMDRVDKELDEELDKVKKRINEAKEDKTYWLIHFEETPYMILPRSYNAVIDEHPLVVLERLKEKEPHSIYKLLMWGQISKELFLEHRKDNPSIIEHDDGSENENV